MVRMGPFTADLVDSPYMEARLLVVDRAFDRASGVGRNYAVSRYNPLFRFINRLRESALFLSK